MTQWEQIKKEYRDIPGPADGPNQMLQTIADAKRKRNRNRAKYLTRYGTVAAAVLLIIVLLPGMLLFSGGYGAKNDAACVETEDVAENGAGFKKSAVADRDEIPVSGDSAPAPEVFLDAGEKSEAAPWLKYREEISKEIIKQMEDRMQNNGETYYIRSDECPEGFELLEEEQEYYVNGEGLWVFVFREGTIAPEEQGIVEFIIPAEVVSP